MWKEGVRGCFFKNLLNIFLGWYSSRLGSHTHPSSFSFLFFFLIFFFTSRVTHALSGRVRLWNCWTASCLLELSDPMWFTTAGSITPLCQGSWCAHTRPQGSEHICVCLMDFCCRVQSLILDPTSNVWDLILDMSLPISASNLGEL